jgi:hypothetical protein
MRSMMAGGPHLHAHKHLFVGSDICKSHPYRINYLRATGRKGFWATRGPRTGSILLPVVHFLGSPFQASDGHQTHS